MTDREKKETRDEKRKRQTDATHAALGRYIEAFEQIVMWLRVGCSQLTCLTTRAPLNVKQQLLMNVVFNHRCMTADNLASIYRALVGQIINDKDMTRFDGAEIKTIEKVLTQFHNDFQEAVNKRNDYIHGTWFIGYGNAASEDWSNIGYLRGKATKEGVKYIEGPKTADDIDAMTKECQRLSNYIHLFQGVFFVSLAHGDSGIRISARFEQTRSSNPRWEPKVPET
jgi:hypothetical protein